MTRYILQMDVEHFFPGTWAKMTKEEQAAWREKWRAMLARRKGNTGVTPGQHRGNKIFCSQISGRKSRKYQHRANKITRESTRGQPPTVEWE